jgi:hypothetical protein
MLILDTALIWTWLRSQVACCVCRLAVCTATAKTGTPHVGTETRIRLAACGVSSRSIHAPLVGVGRSSQAAGLFRLLRSERDGRTNDGTCCATHACAHGLLLLSADADAVMPLCFAPENSDGAKHCE